MPASASAVAVLASAPVAAPASALVGAPAFALAAVVPALPAGVPASALVAVVPPGRGTPSEVLCVQRCSISFGLGPYFACNFFGPPHLVFYPVPRPPLVFGGLPVPRSSLVLAFAFVTAWTGFRSTLSRVHAAGLPVLSH